MLDEPATLLPATSPLAKAMYTRIRPVVPWRVWPSCEIRALCQLTADGLALECHFRGFGPLHDQQAAEAVRAAGVELVLLSPLAPSASAAYKTRARRDMLLYLLLPLLFAIPMVGGLWTRAMPTTVLAFAADVVGLVVFQIMLGRRRTEAGLGRFAVDLPVPGHPALSRRALEEKAGP
jgi:hypothetical protein